MPRQRYMRPLLERILNGEIDPRFVVTHRLPLERGAARLRLFKHKREDCLKVVLKP